MEQTGVSQEAIGQILRALLAQSGHTLMTPTQTSKTVPYMFRPTPSPEVQSTSSELTTHVPQIHPKMSVDERIVEELKKAAKPRMPQLKAGAKLRSLIQGYFSIKNPGKVVNELSKKYTGLADVQQAQLQYLDTEMRFKGLKLAKDTALFTAQKGQLSALTAIIPVLQVVQERGTLDPRLNDTSEALMDALKLLVTSFSQAKLDRLATIKGSVYSVLGKELIKTTDMKGDQLPSNEFLLGGKLGERNKEAMKSARATDNMLGTFYARGLKRKNEGFTGAPFYKKGRGAKNTVRTRGSSFHHTTTNIATPTRFPSDEYPQRGARGRGSFRGRGRGNYGGPSFRK